MTVGGGRECVATPHTHICNCGSVSCRRCGGDGGGIVMGEMFASVRRGARMLICQNGVFNINVVGNCYNGSQ